MRNDPIEAERLFCERWASASVLFGYCWCECGEKTPLATQTRARNAHVKGRPMYYILGHSRRRGRGSLGWDAKDCGYSTPCWVWNGATGDHGYGTLTIEGKTRLAHIVHYRESGKTIPDGYQLDHLCRNPPCCNPEHLEAVPPAINSRRGNNAKLTQEDVDAIRASSLPQASLADKYGVHPSQISRIKSYQMWRPVVSRRRNDEWRIQEAERWAN